MLSGISERQLLEVVEAPFINPHRRKFELASILNEYALIISVSQFTPLSTYIPKTIGKITVLVLHYQSTDSGEYYRLPIIL